MIATMFVDINKNDIIKTYKAVKHSRSNLSINGFIFNYVLKCIENNGWPTIDTYNKIIKALQEKEDNIK